MAACDAIPFPPHRIEDAEEGLGLALQMEPETLKYFPTSNSSKEVRPITRNCKPSSHTAGTEILPQNSDSCKDVCVLARCASHLLDERLESPVVHRAGVLTACSLGLAAHSTCTRTVCPHRQPPVGWMSVWGSVRCGLTGVLATHSLL